MTNPLTWPIRLSLTSMEGGDSNSRPLESDSAPAPRREAPVGQVLEEYIVGHETGDGHYGPTGQPAQLGVDPPEIGDSASVQVKRVEAHVGEFAHDVAIAIQQGQAFAVPTYLRNAISGVLSEPGASGAADQAE